MKKFLSLVLALAMTMTLLASCGGSGDTATTDDATNSNDSTTSNDSTVADGTNIEMVDTNEKSDGIVAGSYATYYVDSDTVSTQIPNSYAGGTWLYGWIYDTLFYSPNGAWDDLTGLLVTDWTLSDDGLTWTLELTDQAYFRNGNPVDAAAVVRCWDYQTETDAITNFADYGTDGDYTVWVTLTATNSEFIQQMAVDHVAIFDVQAWEDNIAAGMDTIEAFTGIGSGPYYVSDYELGASMTFTANENYWFDGRYPSIETIYVPIVSDTSTQQAILQSGDADAGLISDWTVLENLVNNYDLSYYTLSGTSFPLWINTSGHNEYLTDPIVRQALTMMINIEDVSYALSGEYGFSVYNCFNSGIDYQNNYTYDPEGAVALLDSIGVNPSDIVMTGLSNSRQSGIFSNLQAQFAECDVTLNFTVQDDAAMKTAGMSGDWDIWGEHGGLGIGAYRSATMNILSSTAAQKVVLDPVYSTQISTLIENAFSQTTTDATYDMLEEVCSIVAENYLCLGNVGFPSWYVANDTIVNFAVNSAQKYWMPWLSWMA